MCDNLRKIHQSAKIHVCFRKCVYRFTEHNIRFKRLHQQYTTRLKKTETYKYIILLYLHMHWQSVTPQYYNYMFRHWRTIPKLYRHGSGFLWRGEIGENETEFYYGSNITVMESKEKENVRHVVFITEAVDCCNFKIWL